MVNLTNPGKRSYQIAGGTPNAGERPYKARMVEDLYIVVGQSINANPKPRLTVRGLCTALCESVNTARAFLRYHQTIPSLAPSLDVVSGLEDAKMLLAWCGYPARTSSETPCLSSLELDEIAPNEPALRHLALALRLRLRRAPSSQTMQRAI